MEDLQQLGIHHIAVKDLTQKPEKENIIMGTSFWIRIWIAIILVVASEITIYKLTNNDTLSMIIGTFLSSTMIFNCSEVVDYYAKSTLKVKYVATAKIISFIGLSILKILVVLLKLSLEYYALTYLIESIIYSVLLFVSYRIMHKNSAICKWKFDREYAKSLLSKCWYFALSSIMVTIYLKIDQVMLGSLIENKSQVGIYSAAVKIAEMWVFIPNAIIASVKPIIIGYKGKKDEGSYKKSLQKLYDISSGVCIIFALGITIFSKLIIYILYGEQYMEASQILYIMIWGIWFGTLGNVHYIWMVCENKEKYSLFYSLSGCLTNIVLNSILIPRYGMYGAAIATLFSQITTNIFSFMIFKSTRELSKYAIKAIFFVEPIKMLKNRILEVKHG